MPERRAATVARAGDARRGNLLVALALFAGTVAYLAAWPHDLFPFDEGLFLYEARRLLNGDRFYRDFFEIITPGSFYVMAAAFRAFGLTMTVARVTMAVVHALIVVGLYAACRIAGVRVLLAVAAALAHVALCYWGTTYASPHWFSTLLTVALLLVTIRRLRESAGRALALGVLAGMVIAVQQQRGVPVTFGVLVVLITDHLLARRLGRIPEASLGTQLLAYAGGVGLVVVPLLGWCVANAGLEPVFRALVRHPLVNYRSTQRREWGYFWPGISERFYIWPTLIARQWMAPLAAVPRIVWNVVCAGDGAALRTRVALALYAGVAMLSVWYYPDYIHLSIVAPLCLPIAADTVEGIFRAGERGLGLPRAVAGVATVLLLVGLAVRLQYNFETRWDMYPYSRETSFGRVEFRNQDDMMISEVVRRMVGGGKREIFAYPQWASLYLLTGTTNPTRYEVVVPGGYTDQDQIAEIIDVLDAHQVRFVVVALPFLNLKQDPVLVYLARKYERVQLPFEDAKPLYRLYQRLPE